MCLLRRVAVDNFRRPPATPPHRAKSRLVTDHETKIPTSRRDDFFHSPEARRSRLNHQQGQAVGQAGPRRPARLVADDRARLAHVSLSAARAAHRSNGARRAIPRQSSPTHRRPDRSVSQCAKSRGPAHRERPARAQAELAHRVARHRSGAAVLSRFLFTRRAKFNLFFL